MRRQSLTVGAADPAKVRHVMEHLVAAFEAYCNALPDDQPLEYIDAFMGVHNFHKAIVLDLMHRQQEWGIHQRQLFLRMARETWDQAMDQETRKTGQ